MKSLIEATHFTRNVIKGQEKRTRAIPFMRLASPVEFYATHLISFNFDNIAWGVLAST